MDEESAYYLRTTVLTRTGKWSGNYMSPAERERARERESERERGEERRSKEIERGVWYVWVWVGGF